MTKIGNILFDIASTNRIFSKMYADVYGALCSHHDFFVGFLENQYNEYLNDPTNPVFYNPVELRLQAVLNVMFKMPQFHVC